MFIMNKPVNFVNVDNDNSTNFLKLFIKDHYISEILNIIINFTVILKFV